MQFESLIRTNGTLRWAAERDDNGVPRVPPIQGNIFDNIWPSQSKESGYDTAR